jgi:catechol 2,3-dioxygenase-like lactoylglutathione lyase family enzyme
LITATRHTGLVVRDIECSIAFYEALGMRLLRRELETGKFIETVVGIDGVRLEWAKLEAVDGYLLELLQYHSHPHVEPVVPAASNQLGCSHVAFTVSDAQIACRQVVALGGSMVNPPQVAPDGLVCVAYCHDPDGILMELVEVLSENG